jgi:hypothetical protein
MTKIPSTAAILASALALSLTFLNGSAEAQTSQNGPYYATPSWDQTLPVATRFVVLSNFNSQAVLDRETGLVWQRGISPSTFNWADAQTVCLSSFVGSRGGWRLPTFAELLSLESDDNHTGNASISGPFNITGGPTWSATTSANVSTQAHIVILSPGGSVIISAADKGSAFTAWCVRGSSAPSN